MERCLEETGRNKGGNKRSRWAASSSPSPLRVDDAFLFVDIMEEILSRLPLKDMMRYRAVCTAWRNAIDRDGLAAARLGSSARAIPSQPLILLQDDRINRLFAPQPLIQRQDRINRLFVFDREAKSETLLAHLRWKQSVGSSCDGVLLLCHCNDNGIASFVVGNPITGEFLKPPSVPNCDRIRMSQLMRDTTGGGGYKMFIMYTSWHNGVINSLVFTIGVDVSWRKFPNPYHQWSEERSLLVCPRSNGAFHCVYNYDTRFVAAFDMVNEQLREIKYPPGCLPVLPHYRHPYQFSGFQGDALPPPSFCPHEDDRCLDPLGNASHIFT